MSFSASGMPASTTAPIPSARMAARAAGTSLAVAISNTASRLPACAAAARIAWARSAWPAVPR